MKKRLSINKFITAGLCVCLAYVLACCIVLGSYSKKQLLQPGRIFSFSERILSQDGDGLRYDKERQIIRVTEDEAVILLNEMKAAKVWNYLFVELGACSTDFIQIQIDCYNKDGVVFDTVSAQLRAGNNYIALNSSQADKKIAVRLLDAKGTEISLKKMQLRTKLPVSMGRIIWITLLLSAVLYLGASRFMQSAKAKSIWKSLDRYLFKSVRDVFEYIYTELGNHMYLKVREKDRENARSFLFALLFFLQCAALGSGIYADARYYRYCVLVFTMILFMIGVLLIEGKAADKKRERERNWIWTIFWLWTCISDILVGKYYIYTGWIMLIIAGFLFYWWKQMEHPDCLVKNMISGLRLSFIPIFVCCIIFRQSMAVYAVLMLFVFGICFIQKKKWWDGIGMLLAVYLICSSVVRSLEQDSFVITQSFYDQYVIWSGYLRRLNCAGHQDRALKFWGQEWYPGNGILEIAYRYGIFAGVFYTGLLLQGGKILTVQLKKIREHSQIRIFSISVIAVFFIANLFISLEAPFLSPVWIIFYLFLGMGTEKQSFSD